MVATVADVVGGAPGRLGVVLKKPPSLPLARQGTKQCHGALFGALFGVINGGRIDERGDSPPGDYPGAAGTVLAGRDGIESK